VSPNAPPPVPASRVALNNGLNNSDWQRHTHQDSELVKGLGLTSATMLVMGSMIGSGIFIVSAEIARLVDSPALLIGAWLLTGFLTITGALAYGELAAMMPHAGGQYVYLREALGPLWGFLYGWTLYLVIQTGTIAAVGVAFGKFLGILFPSVSSTHWILHLWHVPPIPIGPMVLGNMDVGLNTQNLAAIIIVIFLSVLNIFGVRTGAIVQNIFTIAKTAALLGLVLLGIFVGRNAQAIAANFGANFWRDAGWHSLHAVQVGVGGPIALVGTLTVVAVAQVGSLFSSDAWNNITFTAAEVKNPRRNLPLALALGTGSVILLYVLANLVYLTVLPLQGDAHGATILARGIQHASEDRVATAVFQQMFGPSGAAIMAIAILISQALAFTTQWRKTAFSSAAPRDSIPGTARRRTRSPCSASGRASSVSPAATANCSTTSSSPYWSSTS
jgi:basic amino acid/polyamine antiporter, APA family